MASSDDVFGGSYLSPSGSSLTPRKSPSRLGRKMKSNVSLRGTTEDDEENSAGNNPAANGRFSLAHELAVAMMPEPSAGSKLLAEEFGIEYDEGAEGIDNDNVVSEHHHSSSQPSFIEQFGSNEFSQDSYSYPESDEYGPPDSPIPQPTSTKAPELNAMEILANDLESTDKFLSHLRQIDHVDTLGMGPSSQPNLERFASDVIRRLNDTARDRESQVRELLGYEREFRKIAGEVGGEDLLAQLDELPQTTDVVESAPEPSRRLEELPEAEEEAASDDWEADHRYHDDDDEDEDEFRGELMMPLSPPTDSFPPPPPLVGPPSATQSISQLAHLRTFTASLVTSLATISEQAQVNGAATTEAGRKIRALKNKMGGWQTDFESAEKSRSRIEKWEAGIIEGASAATETPSRGAKRIDGRKLVEVQLHEFERALADAAERTRIIMAS